jgi:hypothetical protein
MILGKAVLHRKGAENAEGRKGNQRLSIFLIDRAAHPKGE